MTDGEPETRQGLKWFFPLSPHTGTEGIQYAQLRLTLGDPMDYSTPGSSLHGIFPGKILEWVANASSRGSS